MVTPKIDAWSSAPISSPTCYELAISRMKKGGGWSNHDQSYLLSLTVVVCTSTSRTPILTSTHTLSLYIQLFTLYLSQEAMGNIQMNAWSLLFTHPRGVSPVWCWNWQQTIHTLWHFFSLTLLSCSSRAVLVHLACLACTTIQRWVPSVVVMRKSQFQWRTHECPVHWFSTR